MPFWQGSVVEDSMLTWACRYVEALGPKSFSEHDLMDPQARFYFREKAIASKSGNVSQSERDCALFGPWHV